MKHAIGHCLLAVLSHSAIAVPNEPVGVLMDKGVAACEWHNVGKSVVAK